MATITIKTVEVDGNESISMERTGSLSEILGLLEVAKLQMGFALAIRLENELKAKLAEQKSEGEDETV